MAERNGSSSLSGFQPASPVAVAVALAGLRTVLVVIPPNRVAGFTLKRFFHDQPRCQLDQLILGRTCGLPAFDQRCQTFTRALRSRWSRRHGVLLCWARHAR